MQSKYLLMEEWLKEKINNCEKQRTELLCEERKDEANFCKIEENIYEVFLTVLSVADKKCGEDETSFVQFFRERLKTIPENWKESLERAKQHGDVDKAHIETIKLDTVQRIEKEYDEIWER